MECRETAHSWHLGLSMHAQGSSFGLGGGSANELAPLTALIRDIHKRRDESSLVVGPWPPLTTTSQPKTQAIHFTLGVAIVMKKMSCSSWALCWSGEMESMQQHQSLQDCSIFHHPRIHPPQCLFLNLACCLASLR